MGQGQQFGWLKMDELKQLAAVERLANLEGNKLKTAESLGITRVTLDAILHAFEKRTEAEQARIKLNADKVREIMNQNKDAFEHDAKTGFSNPKAPAPLPKIELFKPRSMGEDPLNKAAEAINNTPRPVSTFKPVITPSPVIPVPKPLADEAKREKEHFDKLDKTPYSVVHNQEGREQRERADLAAVGKKKGTKPT